MWFQVSCTELSWVPFDPGFGYQKNLVPECVTHNTSFWYEILAPVLGQRTWFKIRRTATPKKTDNKITLSYTSTKNQTSAVLYCICIAKLLYCWIILVTSEYYASVVTNGTSYLHPQRGRHQECKQIQMCSVWNDGSSTVSKHFPNRKSRFVEDNTWMTFWAAWSSWCYPQSSIFLLQVLRDRVSPLLLLLLLLLVYCYR